MCTSPVARSIQPISMRGTVKSSRSSFAQAMRNGVIRSGVVESGTPPSGLYYAMLESMVVSTVARVRPSAESANPL